MIKRHLKNAIKREGIALLILVCTVIGVFAFARIAVGVRSGRSNAWDQSIMLALRTDDDGNDPIGPGWVEEMARDATALGGIPFMVFIVAASGGILLLRRDYETVVLLVLAMTGALCLSFSLKYGFDRPRPSLVAHKARVYSRSFPSSHSTMAAATYLTIGAILARIHSQRAIRVFVMALALGLTMLVGVSRVYLGVHWPTDVLAGWAAGSVWAMVCWTLAAWHRKSRRSESPTT